MKIKLWVIDNLIPILIFGLLFILICIFVVITAVEKRQYESDPKYPITIALIPRQTVEVDGHWKMGSFVIGYRIITDKYVIISGYGGLFGQEGMTLVGPGAVERSKVATFSYVFSIAQRVKNTEKIVFYGNLLCDRRSGKPILFEGKEVIDLYMAKYKGQTYKINRKYFDNN